MVKLHDLGKTLGYKADEFIRLIQSLGFNYHSFAQSISEEEATKIRDSVAGVKPALELAAKVRKMSWMTMIGVHYDFNTGKYHMATIRLYPDEFEKYGVQLSKPYSTIDMMAWDLNKETIDAGFSSPSELERLRRKEKNK